MVKLAFTDKVRQNLKKLPSLPFVVQKVIETLNSPKSSISSVAEVISKDQYLTSVMLKIANSAYYGYPRRIETVKQAIIIMGFKSVSDILLTISVLDIFNKSKIPGFNIVSFWEHAIGTAVAAKIIGKRVGYVPAEELFTPGLLHDLGKAVMSSFFMEDYRKVIKDAVDGKKWIGKAESDILETTHATIGKIVAESWNLPEKIVAAIWKHHRPMQEKKYTRLVSIVHVADVLSWALKIGSGGGSVPPKLDPEAWSLSGLTPKTTKGLAEAIKRDFNSAKSIFSIR